MKKRLIALVSTVVVVASIAGGVYFGRPMVSAEEPPRPQMAPEVNLAGGVPPVINGHGTGFVPPPVDLSHLRGELLQGVKAFEERLQAEGVSAPPRRFDWRERGMVSSVKNQGACGSCYAFAAIANFESRLRVLGLSSEDFSENNVKECNWYHTSCGGGNYGVVVDFLTKNDLGAVWESNDPYLATYVNCTSRRGIGFVPGDWNMICGDVVPSTDVLKSYVYAYGPVYTTMYASFPGFDTYDGSYTLYYTGTERPNHAVLIVGWDDDLTHAGGMGGWICKNSWGTNWGGTCGYGSERGYFTIAYGSASIGMYSSFVREIDDVRGYGFPGKYIVFSYPDEGGWNRSWGFGTTTAWGLVKFGTGGFSNFKAYKVEFWTTDVTTDVDVYLYDDFDGSKVSGLLASKLDNRFNEAGYHSVWLDSPVNLPDDNDVVVVVKFTNRSWIYPVATDCRGINETQVTYLSPDGSAGSWIDMGQAYRNSVAIRLRISEDPPPPPETPPPVCGDRIGVFRPSGRYWYLDVNGDGSGLGDPFLGPFSQPATDIQIVGDWNGDGYDEIGLWRTSDRKWYLDYNGNGLWDGEPTDKVLGPFGQPATDKPLVGNWNGAGGDEVGVWRTSDRKWYLDYNGNGVWDGEPTDRVLGPFGQPATDKPVVGDWNCDGRDETGVWRTSDCKWYLDYNGNGVWDDGFTDRVRGPYGFDTDVPIVGNWRR